MKEIGILKNIWELKFLKLNLGIGVSENIWKLKFLKIKFWHKKDEETRGPTLDPLGIILNLNNQSFTHASMTTRIKQIKIVMAD